MLSTAYKNVRDLLRINHSIFHLRLNFPLVNSKVESCLAKLRSVEDEQADALILSIRGQQGRRSHYSLLDEALRSTAGQMRIPIFTFIEDIVSNEAYLLSTIGQKVHATPFSVVGEIGVYYYSVNFKKLMDKLNIDIYRMSNGKPTIWGHFQEPPQQEKEFSDKYINQMDKAMVDTIAGRRKIDVSQVESVKGKLLTAQKALDLGLIDKIQTFDEFKQINFPNHKVVEYSLPYSAPRLIFTALQRHIFNELHVWVESSIVPQYYFPDTTHLVEDLMTILQNRANDFQFMEFFDKRICPLMLKLIESTEQSKLVI